MPQPEGRLPRVVKKKEGLMPELRKRRSHLALLGVFAMVASVLAVGASPAAAVAGKVEGAASYSACVGPATADAGFTDVATGSTHDAAINCIAYYGITRGTSASTFSPNRTIPRWQLAVMLQRAAAPAGVTLPTAASQGFTDISDLSASFQTAVNQMAAMGIMAGTTATTFDPNGVVSRTTIVEALAGFLTSARVGPGGKALTRNLDRSLTLKESAASNASVITIDENFRDIGGVTYSAYQSIRALAEMGVVSGRGDGTFGPAASVTRGQAAAFITRALAHTNARPAGLTMQSSTAASTGSGDITLAISVRGNDFSVRDSVAVDVFSHLTANMSTAFMTDGTCKTSGSGAVQDARGAGGACVMEVDDDVTEPDGNLMVEVDAAQSPTTYWAWTGAVGDKLDWNKANLSMDNSVVSDAASVSVSNVKVATKAKVSLSVSSDATGGQTVRYGTTVTVTVQLADANDENVGLAGKTYQWWATGVHSPNPDRRPIPGTGTRTITTGADGSASFTLTQTDPDTNHNVDGPGEDPAANDMTTWTYYIVATGTAPVAPVENNGDGGIGFTVSNGQGSGSLVFDDNDPIGTKLSIELARRWTPKPTSGNTARVGVTAKVTDQYGTPMRGKPVFFELVNNTNSATAIGCDDNPADGCTADNSISDGGAGTISGTTKRVTRSNGTNTVSAVYKATADARGMATDKVAFYKVATDFNDDDDVGDPGEMALMIHYWTVNPVGYDAETGTATPQLGSYRGIQHVDMVNNVIVYDHMSESRTARYSDTTIFKWYVENDDDYNELRWIGEAEMERRIAAHAKGPAAAALSDVTNRSPWLAKLNILQYNDSGKVSTTGISFSILEIELWATRPIQDPPARG